jgi:hypothetical protein
MQCAARAVCFSWRQHSRPISMGFSDVSLHASIVPHATSRGGHMAARLGKRICILLVGSFLLPLVAQAQPTMATPFLFTERRGATSFWDSDYSFVMGSTSIVSSGSGTNVFATHEPFGSGPDYALNFSPSPWFPNLYAVRTAYSGQTGQWNISATNSTGTTVRQTHVLDDVRDMPLIGGLTASGSALAPHLSWDAVDGSLFPSWCGMCVLGSDLFTYQIEIRLASAAAPIVYQSPGLSTVFFGTFDETPAFFDVPTGVLSADTDYLISVRLNHNDIEAFLPGGGLFAPLENRSSAFLFHSTTAPIPEPETYAMLLAGLAMLGFIARRRRSPRVTAT